MLLTFSFINLNLLIIVILNFLFDNPKYVSFLSLVLMLALFLQTVFLLPFIIMSCNFLLKSRLMCWVVGSEVNESLALGRLYINLSRCWSVFNVYIGSRGFKFL